MKTTTFMGFCMPVILAAFVCGCTASSKDTSAQQENKPELPVVTLKSVDTVLKSAYVADVQAVKNVEIRTRVKGFLEKIYVDEGQTVKKGQLLFKISDEDYRVMLSKAKAALSNAQAAVRATELENARIKMLVDKKVISKSELDVAAAKLTADLATVDEARSSVQSAENHMAYTSLRAPFDGIIDRIPLKAGSLLEEGALLTDISDISSMFAYFSFPENEYLKYERNKNTGTADRNVTLLLSDGSNYKHAGKIEIIEAQIEQSTGSIDLRARFPNPEKLLRHGATAKLFITSAADSVILVPQQSVFDIQDKSYVYLVDKNNTLRMKAFVPISRLAHSYVVKGSLQPGDRILYEGTQSVRDGQVVKPVTKAKTNMVAFAK